MNVNADDLRLLLGDLVIFGAGRRGRQWLARLKGYGGGVFGQVLLRQRHRQAGHAH